MDAANWLTRWRVGLLLVWVCCLCVKQVQAVDLPPIRIGATVSLEGPYQEPSMMIRKAFLLWQQEVNQQGGLLGREVELILYNDKSRPDLVRDSYRRLIEEDRVDGVFSPYGTPLTLAASAVSEKHHMLMLACAASGSRIWERGFRYVFGMYALAGRYFIGLLDLMARSGRNSLSLVYAESSAFHLDVAAGVKKWAKKFHIELDSEQRYENGEAELPKIAVDLKERQVQGLILSAYPPDCYRLLDQMKQTDFRPRVLGMTIAPIHPNFFNKAGDIGDRIFGPSQWEPSERIPFPGTRQFVRSFQEFADIMPSYHAGSAYAACELFAQAVRQTRTLDNDTIRNYIAALDTVTVIGRFKVDPSGRQVGHNPIMIQWQQGKKEIVWPSTMQTAAPLW